MRTRSVILAFIISFGLVLAMTATSLATTMINFSGPTIDGADASQLGAEVEYYYDGSDTEGILTINVSNNAIGYVISTLYFNISTDVTPQKNMVLKSVDYVDVESSPFPDAKLKAKSSKWQIGLSDLYYDVIFEFDKDYDDGILYHETYSFQVSVQGNNLGDDDFFVPRSAIAILDFTQEGNHIYTTPLTSSAPEPATMLLFGTGLVGLLGLGRKKGFIKE